MRHVRLGRTGLKVSQLCLGMMTFGDPNWRPYVLDAAGSEPIVGRAIEAGVTFFDTADVYSRGASEQITGRLLRQFFSRREEYVIATKVRGRMGNGPNDAGLSRGHILDGVDASLRRLGIDHIDLLQVHRWDREVPLEETMQALDDVVRSGKVRYIGASNMPTWYFAKAQRVAALGGWTEFETMQLHYNLLYREAEREMFPFCEDSGVGVLCWSPLARGRLARSEEQQDATLRSTSDDRILELYTEEAEAEILRAVGRVAQARGSTRGQVALAWTLTKPMVTAPIVGVTREQHLDEAVAATELVLTPDEVSQLERAYRCRSEHPIEG